MQLGQLIVGSQSTLTPWFPRQGDNAVFSYEFVADLGGGTDMEISVLHKNTEESGEGVLATPVSGSPEWPEDGDTDIFSATYMGLKELVRFNVASTSALGVVYRMLEPTWFDDAKP